MLLHANGLSAAARTQPAGRPQREPLHSCRTGPARSWNQLEEEQMYAVAQATETAIQGRYSSSTKSFAAPVDQFAHHAHGPQYFRRHRPQVATPSRRTVRPARPTCSFDCRRTSARPTSRSSATNSCTTATEAGPCPSGPTRRRIAILGLARAHLPLVVEWGACGERG